MDCSRGIICRGPAAPRPLFYFTGTISSLNGDGQDAAATVDLLKEEVLMRYLASFKSKEIDRGLLDVLARGDAKEKVPEWVCQPTVICKSTNTPIAVANNAWQSLWGPLVEREVLGNGWIR